MMVTGMNDGSHAAMASWGLDLTNVPVLIVVLVLTIPVAILAMRLAERALKKQTEGVE